MNIEISELLLVRPEANTADPVLTSIGIAGLKTTANHGRTNVAVRRNSTLFDLFRFFSSKNNFKRFSSRLYSRMHFLLPPKLGPIPLFTAFYRFFSPKKKTQDGIRQLRGNALQHELAKTAAYRLDLGALYQ